MTDITIIGVDIAKNFIQVHGTIITERCCLKNVCQEKNFCILWQIRSVVQASKKINKVTGSYHKTDPHSQWVRKLADRLGTNKASVAIANKNARIVIALLKNQTTFDAKLAH